MVFDRGHTIDMVEYPVDKTDNGLDLWLFR